MRVPSVIASPITAAVLAFLQAGWALMATDLPTTCPPGKMARIVTELATLEAVVTLVLGLSLFGTARRRGHRGGWAAMALLSLAGVAVVYCLPDRSGRHRPGFPVVEPTRERT